MSELTEKKQSISEMAQNLSPVTPVVAQQVAQLSAVINCLRTELNKDLPIQHVALLLAVVQKPGISMQELMEQLGMPQGSVSRNVKLLSGPTRGYGMLQTVQGEVKRKQVVVHPTEKCLLLVQRLCQLMQP